MLIHHKLYDSYKLYYCQPSPLKYIEESVTGGSVPACQRGASPWCVAAAEIGVKVGALIPSTDTNQINRKYCKSFATDQIPCGASKIKKRKVKEGSIGNQASMYAICTGSGRESAKVKLFLFLTPLPPQIPMRLSFCRLSFFLKLTVSKVLEFLLHLIFDTLIFGTIL